MYIPLQLAREPGINTRPLKCVISCYPPCKEGNTRFTIVHFKPLMCVVLVYVYCVLHDKFNNNQNIVPIYYLSFIQKIGLLFTKALLANFPPPPFPENWYCLKSLSWYLILVNKYFPHFAIFPWMVIFFYFYWLPFSLFAFITLSERFSSKMRLYNRI